MTTLFDSTAPLRFAAKGVAGDAIDVIEFTLEGEAALAAHEWTAQLRDRAGRLKADLEVERSVVTVTSADDSVQVTVRMSAAHSSGLRRGVYMVETSDVTAKRTWATGTLAIRRDWNS